MTGTPEGADVLMEVTEDMNGNTDVTEAVLAQVMAAGAATQTQEIA